MSAFAIPSRPFAQIRLTPPVVMLAALTLLVAAAVIAQVEGERGIAPVVSSSDIEVFDIEVNAVGANSEEAREKGWMEARRKAREKLDGPAISDSQLDGLVSAIIIQREQIGPRRYIATVGVIFDRARTGGLLGAANGPSARSAPMLTVPVLVSGGAKTVYEVRNEWQRAWAEWQTGQSAIDYVRPSGAGGESLLVNYGQLGRRSRGWWRGVLDYFSAADVIIPIAKLEQQWPGGPVEGHFIARYGPDNRYLDEFRLTAESEEQVPEMLRQALLRFDAIFTRALADGQLRPDPTLRSERVEINPAIRAVLERARRATEAEALGEIPLVPENGEAATSQAQVVNSFTVQFATPDGAALDSGLAALRSMPGVRGAVISSTAVGGVSVMRISYAGELPVLAAALRARGYQVTEGTNALAISR
jgi:hypothetical protein